MTLPFKLTHFIRYCYKSIGYLSPHKYNEQYFKNNQPEKTIENQKQLIKISNQP